MSICSTPVCGPARRTSGARWPGRFEDADAAQRAAEDQQRLNDLLAATPTAQLEKTRETMQFLADAFEAGRINAEQFSEAANAALGNIAEQGQGAGRRAHHILGSGRPQHAGFARVGVHGAEANFGKMLQGMIAQAVAADIMSSLFGKGRWRAGCGGRVRQVFDMGPSFFRLVCLLAPTTCLAMAWP